jgi:hypothetical protein
MSYSRRSLIEPEEEQQTIAKDIASINKTFAENVKRYQQLSKIILSGPVSLTFIPYFDGRAFYIFGDIHVVTADCDDFPKALPISRFLNDRFQNHSLPPKSGYVDFYFEHYLPETVEGIQEHWRGMEGTPIHTIETQFSQCLKTVNKKTVCAAWPKTRFHSTDLRFTSQGIPEVSLFTALENLTSYNGLYYQLQPFLFSGQEYLKYIDQYFLGNLSQVLNLAPGIMEEYEKLKELVGRDETFLVRRFFKELSGSYLNQQMYEWALPKFTDLSRRIDAILNSQELTTADLLQISLGSGTFGDDDVKGIIWPSELKNSLYEVSKYINTKYDKLTIETTNVLPAQINESLDDHLTLLEQVYLETKVLLTDIYTLSRIFKTNTLNAHSREVWIYVGDLHAENLKDFLKFVGGRNFGIESLTCYYRDVFGDGTEEVHCTERRGNDYKQCLQIKPMDFPILHPEKSPDMAVVL